MATSIDQSEYVKTALRLPPDLHKAIHDSAKEAGRSYNAELIARLIRSFEPPGDLGLLANLRRVEVELAELDIELTVRTNKLAQAINLAQRLAIATEEYPELVHGVTAKEVEELNSLLNYGKDLMQHHTRSPSEAVEALEEADKLFEEALLKLREHAAIRAGLPVESVRASRKPKRKQLPGMLPKP